MVSFLCSVLISSAVLIMNVEKVSAGPPSFLNGAYEEAIVKFEVLKNDKTMSKPAKEDAVQNLINSLGGDFPAKYAAWRAKKTAELQIRINTFLEEEDEKTAYFTRKEIQESRTLIQEERKIKLTALLTPLAPTIRFHIMKVRNNPTDWNRIGCRGCTEKDVVNLLTEPDYFWDEPDA